MKLILLNGATGVGKSTIALTLRERMPHSFLLDIDEQRRNISNYREHPEESRALSFLVAESIIDTCLAAETDVIVDKYIVDENIISRLIACGERHGANIHEYILNAPLATIIERTHARGFRPGGLLTPEKVEGIWRTMQAYISHRPQAHVLDTSALTSDEIVERIHKEINNIDL